MSLGGEGRSGPRLLGGRSRATDDPEERVRRVQRQATSVLLGYPDTAFYERLPLVCRALLELPDGPARAALSGFCEHAATTPELELGAHYVRTFDLRRRRSLHLTYYTDGDTRRRGHALVRLKEVYAACGWTLGAEELPDHLAVLLEFAGRGDAEWGETLLLRFRPALELLRSALHAHGTPYAAVLDAVCAALPPPSEEQRAAAHRLAEEGPPTEQVGLEPFGAGPTPTMLGMPEVPEARPPGDAPSRTRGGRAGGAR